MFVFCLNDNDVNIIDLDINVSVILDGETIQNHLEVWQSVGALISYFPDMPLNLTSLRGFVYEEEIDLYCELPVDSDGANCQATPDFSQITQWINDNKQRVIDYGIDLRKQELLGTRTS